MSVNPPSVQFQRLSETSFRKKQDGVKDFSHRLENMHFKASDLIGLQVLPQHVQSHFDRPGPDVLTVSVEVELLIAIPTGQAAESVFAHEARHKFQNLLIIIRAFLVEAGQVDMHIALKR